MTRRGWLRPVPVLLGALLSLLTLASPSPAHADTPCGAIPNKPIDAGLDVTFGGHGLCTNTVESIRVHVNGFYRPINSTDPVNVRELVSATTECFEFGGVRCPTQGEATATHSLAGGGCYYYWTNVVIDVMYKGSLVYIDHVDSQNSIGPGEPGELMCAP